MIWMEHARIVLGRPLQNGKLSGSSWSIRVCKWSGDKLLPCIGKNTQLQMFMGIRCTVNSKKPKWSWQMAGYFQGVGAEWYSLQKESTYFVLVVSEWVNRWEIVASHLEKLQKLHLFTKKQKVKDASM